MAYFSSIGKTPSVKDILISGSMNPRTHLFASIVGSTSHPALELFSVDMTCVTSV